MQCYTVYLYAGNQRLIGEHKQGVAERADFSAQAAPFRTLDGDLGDELEVRPLAEVPVRRSLGVEAAQTSRAVAHVRCERRPEETALRARVVRRERGEEKAQRP